MYDDGCIYRSVLYIYIEYIYRVGMCSQNGWILGTLAIERGAVYE